MALSCAELRQRLDADEALDAADVREHVAGCAECRRALERWRAVAGEMRVWAEAPPPAFLHTRIMAGLRAAAEAEPRGWRTWFGRRPVWASSALAAAFVLVVASVVMLRVPQVTQAPQSPSAAQGPMPAAPSAMSRHSFAVSEAERKGAAEQRLLANPLKQEEETSRIEERHAEPEAQPKRESEPRVPSIDEFRAGKEEAPRDVERAAVPAAPAPQSRVSGGTAGAPAPRPGSDAAIAEDKAIEPLTVQSAPAQKRAAAEEPAASRAKVAAPRVRARLVPLAGGPARSVEVSSALLAPGPRLIDVDADGLPQVVAAAAKPDAARGISASDRRGEARLSGSISDEPLLAQDDRKAIESLALTPGRYRLERIDK